MTLLDKFTKWGAVAGVGKEEGDKKMQRQKLGQA
jgi:hypothetical protein